MDGAVCVCPGQTWLEAAVASTVHGEIQLASQACYRAMFLPASCLDVKVGKVLAAGDTDTPPRCLSVSEASLELVHSPIQTAALLRSTSQIQFPDLKPHCGVCV